MTPIILGRGLTGLMVDETILEDGRSNEQKGIDGLLDFGWFLYLNSTRQICHAL